MKFKRKDVLECNVVRNRDVICNAIRKRGGLICNVIRYS